MEITISRFQLVKRHALTISRGTSAGSENLLVAVTHEGVTGFGEMAPTSGGDVPETAETAEAALRAWTPLLTRFAPWEMQEIESVLDACAPVPPMPEGDATLLPLRPSGERAARAALDCALHDWLGKRLGVPIGKLFGLNRARIAPTSLTIGINPPEIVRELTPEILARTGARALKVKLGSPAGIEADKAMFAAAQEAAKRPNDPTTRSIFDFRFSISEGGAGKSKIKNRKSKTAQRPNLSWRVDANGGWSVADAREMVAWLAARGVEFVEQPLPRGQEADLPAVHKNSPLPLFADESVHLAQDIPPLAHCMDGVNLKLMKCGGLREALRIIHAARAHGLKVMMGCMSESALAITAAAHLSPLADFLDLDSHLNLVNDPFLGATLTEGRVVPNDSPGLGVQRKEP